MTNKITQYPSNSDGQTIHIAPANGMPLGSYNSLISLLSDQFNVTGMDNRATWPDEPLPRESFRWSDHADDLIAGIEQNHSSPVIGVGHSLGAQTTLMAAIKRPDLFSKIILIDPASTPTWFKGLIFTLAPKFLAYRLFKFIARTRARKNIWESRQQFIDNYRNHPTYKNLTDQVFIDYAQHGLKQKDDGQFELVYPPEWEAYNFRRVEFLWRYLKKSPCPTLVLRAEHSYMYSKEQFDQNNAKLPSHIQPQQLDKAGHLAPHENPQLVADTIKSWLNESAS